ncbi:butyrate kinase [Thermanaeromonas toyohensis ToBE]|uniref:Probable butyrate kinase n=1 Tax=Thermanaeromonas toyohensis ToBE TaxID=698762 RepID=A0A1W1V5P0_9FIRM|nr:butyrate kinase [Thermanaeromonas toyohensis]SMB88668.1 butyrate kinase [Thermanaeromonas toyohensis ToBE]
MRHYYILTINPGSTSTKIAFYQNIEPLFTETIRHKMDELAQFPRIIEQLPFRRDKIMNFLKDKDIPLTRLSAVVGRGGLLRPLPSGTYRVNEKMLKDLREGSYGEHASNLGALLAAEIASEAGVLAYVVDPPCVDELDPLARVSGCPEIERRSLFHALNVKAVARRVCRELGERLENINLLVAHMGGGISVCALKRGKVIDVNNALAEGPFSPERAGGLPTLELARLCFSGRYTWAEVYKKLVGQGGLVAYLGTQDATEVEKRIEQGDEKARLIYEAMAYQVAKELGSMAAVLKGEVRAIVFTGGLAYSSRLTSWIKERVEFIAPVLIYPGEDEMKALAEGALRVLMGEEKALEY